MTITGFRDYLTEKLPGGVYHWSAPQKAPERYILWGERGQRILYADDNSYERITTGDLYYVTKTEYDSFVDELIEECGERGITINIDDIGFDDDRYEISYAMTFEFAGEKLYEMD